MMRIVSGTVALAAAAASVAQQPADHSHAVPLSGSWAYAPTADGSQAVFRDTSNRPQLTLQCTRSLRRVTISKPATAAAPGLQIWTTSQSRTVPAGFDAANARLNVALSATDPLLDAIAFSRGRVAVQVPGSPALVLPPWPEALHVIEDCRA